jgi:hypothetical protein
MSGIENPSATLYDSAGVEKGTAANPLRTDPTGSTAQPVNGAVTANIGTSGSLALDATLTGGTQKAIVRGGAKGATAAADATTTAEGADHQAVDVQIMHGGAAKDPTQIRALTSADVVTAAQGTAAAVAGGWPVKITDGTTVAGVDTANHQYVSGKSAAGIAPTANPVSVSGVDGGGLKRAVLTDTVGRITTAPKTGTSAVTSVASSVTSVSLLAANAGRLGATVHNDGTANLFVKLGATASATSFTVRIATQGYYEVPFGYTGAIDGIWSVANGSARITELT